MSPTAKITGLTFRPGHWETAAMAANAVFALAALLFILYEFEFRGAEFLIFMFAYVFVASSLLVYWRAGAVLIVTRNGFFQRYLGSSQHVKWTECSDFRVAPYRRYWLIKGVAVVFDESKMPHTKRAERIRRRFGVSGVIDQNFGMPADELAAFLNERRTAALTNS